MRSPPDRAVFLDRDGVINRRRLDHVKSWSEFEFLPGSLLALRRLSQRGERVVVITNQSVVGRGLISAEELDSINRRMLDVVETNGGCIEKIYSCLHSPTAGCTCRKPGIELLRRAARELGINLEHSVLVGDSVSDLYAAQSAGCSPIFIGRAPVEEMDVHVSVATDLAEAVALIASSGDRSENWC